MSEARIRPCLEGARHVFTTKPREGYAVPQLRCARCQHWLEDLRTEDPAQQAPEASE